MTSQTYHREIAAPLEVVFDLCRSVDFHLEAAKTIQAKAIGGQKTGLSEEGAVTVYSARFYGCRFQLTMEISDFHPPFEFRDSMTRGLFTHFSHHYLLTPIAEGCLLKDTFSFELPLRKISQFATYSLIQPALEKAQNTRLDAIRKKSEESYS